MNLNQYAPGIAQTGLSIENLKSVLINVPLFFDHKKIVSPIQKLETKITALQNEIAAIPSQKEAVLKKYL